MHMYVVFDKPSLEKVIYRFIF